MYTVYTLYEKRSCRGDVYENVYKNFPLYFRRKCIQCIHYLTSSSDFMNDFANTIP